MSCNCLHLLTGGLPPPAACRHYRVPAAPLLPTPRRSTPVPLWIGSWGSKAGMRRVARLGDGWLASAYNTAPDAFGAAKRSLSEQLDSQGRDPTGFPNALVTMWTWISDDAGKADRMVREVLAPLLRRDPDTLRDQVCVGPAGRCAELLRRYADAGCERVYLWPLGDEPQQIELAAAAVLPAVAE
jgi:alkanesulfonate monooxygenase SsuD/methylene tetrahydromethanopterin reductase-like flavin-dependent oxidoreductase (luciferase family)